MFFNLFKKRAPKEPLQDEYVDLLIKMMDSPLWDGSDAQLQSSLPGDLNQATLDYARKKYTKLHT